MEVEAQKIVVVPLVRSSQGTGTFPRKDIGGSLLEHTYCTLNAWCVCIWWCLESEPEVNVVTMSESIHFDLVWVLVEFTLRDLFLIWDRALITSVVAKETSRPVKLSPG